MCRLVAFIYRKMLSSSCCTVFVTGSTGDCVCAVYTWVAGWLSGVSEWVSVCWVVVRPLTQCTHELQVDWAACVSEWVCWVVVRPLTQCTHELQVDWAACVSEWVCAEWLSVHSLSVHMSCRLIERCEWVCAEWLSVHSLSVHMSCRLIERRVWVSECVLSGCQSTH